MGTDIVGLAAQATICVKSVTVTPTGATSGWLTDPMKLIATGLTTSLSDGYLIDVKIAGAGADAVADGNWVGGCIATSTSNAVCINAKGLTDIIQAMKVYSLTKAKYLATTVVSGGTEITLAGWNMKLGLDCSRAGANDAAASTAGCLFAGAGNLGVADSTTSYGWSNYQPKETSDKVYTGLPRFSKGDILGWTPLTRANGYPVTACGTAKALTGASALVAGAAIAFGAAALAF